MDQYWRRGVHQAAVTSRSGARNMQFTVGMSNHNHAPETAGTRVGGVAAVDVHVHVAQVLPDRGQEALGAVLASSGVRDALARERGDGDSVHADGGQIFSGHWRDVLTRHGGL